MKKIFFFLLVLLSLTSCNDEPIDITVYNTSEETVGCFVAVTFPDSLFVPMSIPDNDWDDLIKIPPYGKWKFRYPVYGLTQHENFWTGRVLQVLFFKQSTMEKYSLQEVKEKEIFDKRIILSHQMLEIANYCVAYTEDDE